MNLSAQLDPRLDGATRNDRSATTTAPTTGDPLEIGKGFSARSFRAARPASAMDPFVMVDHYVMTEPTFGIHPHAGLAAVSLLFEDSVGRFHNRDSLGNNFDLLPGDLYWLNAGGGALHDEAPRPGSRTHGLQIFVNLPEALRYEDPSSLLVRRQDMPAISQRGHRVHVALGESNGVIGSRAPGLPITMLDGQLQALGTFEHELRRGRNAWVLAVNGPIDVTTESNRISLEQGEAIAINNAASEQTTTLRLHSKARATARFALLDGQALKEPYVQRGPFVMGSAEALDQAVQEFEAGRFGTIR